MAKNAERFPDLREFIKENDQRLYDFCFYMIHDGVSIDDLAIEIFRDFGDHYRKLARKHDSVWEPIEIRILLFQIAWETIQWATQRIQYTWTVGRDTRPMKNFDDDLIAAWQGKNKEKNPGLLEDAALERLVRVDPDFRAPVVLRDVLKFEDEEVVRILGTRWGVYRHRLHRGRLEFKDGLRGRPSRVELTKSASI